MDATLVVGIAVALAGAYVYLARRSAARFREMGRALGYAHGTAFALFLGEYPRFRLPFVSVEVRENGILIGLGRKALSFTWDQIIEASRETRPVIFPRWHPYGRTGAGEMMMEAMPHLRLEVDDGSERAHILRFLVDPGSSITVADLIIHRWKYGHWPPGNGRVSGRGHKP